MFPLETEGDVYVQLHLLTQQCSDSQLCLTLCDPMDCSLPGSSVHGILQVRILELVAIASSRRSSRPRDRIHISLSPALADGFFVTSATWKAHKSAEE